MNLRIVGIAIVVVSLAGCIGGAAPEDDVGSHELGVCSAAPLEPVPAESGAEAGGTAAAQGWYVCACPLHNPACDDCQAATSRDECLAGICENASGASASCRYVRWSPFPGPY